jgi:transcriptional regulator with XRE-family HTH domain
MSRPRKRTSVQKALIQLRKKLGLSQQGLSEALKVTSISVCRWETSRPPTGFSLLKLEQFAHDSSAPEIAAIFRRAIDVERPKHFYKFPVPPDEEALREQRFEAHERGTLRRQRAYLQVLDILVQAHADLTNMPLPEGDSGNYRIWDNTQKNLEWLLKHEKEDFQKYGESVQWNDGSSQY